MSTAGQIFFRVKRQLQPLQAMANIIKAKREVKFAFSHLDTPPILIYQMGKVGSTTVYKSLKDAVLANSIFHVHFLSSDLTEAREWYIKAGVYPPPYHIYLGESIREVLKRNTYCPCKIISLVRDPIAIVVSNLFQNPYITKENLNAVVNNTIDPEKGLKILDQNLRNQHKKDSYVNRCFDRELKKAFDIDVFAKPFPRDVGYAVYRKAEVEALVIRLEDLSQKGPIAISEFLGLDDHLILKQSNVRNESKDVEAYQEVLEKICLNPSLCREIYSSRFVKHFYNRTEINKFISKWTKSSSD